jgi:hypothetical protein
MELFSEYMPQLALNVHGTADIVRERRFIAN